MLIPHRRNPRHSPQQFLQLVAQHSRAFSMDDPHARHPDHNRIIHISCHLLYRIIQPLAPHIHLSAEIQFPLIDGRIHLHRRRRPCRLLHRTLELIGSDSLHLVMRQLRTDVSDDDHNSLSRHLRHLSDHAVLLYPHLLSHLQRCRTECLHSLLLSLLLAHLLQTSLVGLLLLPLLSPCPSFVNLLYLPLDIVLSFLLLLFLLRRQQSEESLQLASGFMSCLLFRL